VAHGAHGGSWAETAGLVQGLGRLGVAPQLERQSARKMNEIEIAREGTAQAGVLALRLGETPGLVVRQGALQLLL